MIKTKYIKERKIKWRVRYEELWGQQWFGVAHWWRINIAVEIKYFVSNLKNDKWDLLRDDGEEKFGGTLWSGGNKFHVNKNRRWEIVTNDKYEYY